MFSKETEYALKGLVYIQVRNNSNQRPGIAEIAKEIDAPYFFTAKILQRLVKQGFVESSKGKGGGFYFDTNKPKVSLKNLVTSIEGDKSFSGCGFGLKQCNENNPCPLHSRYAAIREAIQNLLNNESVQSLALKLTEGRKKEFNWLG
jgi:Rrf2 family protein